MKKVVTSFIIIFILILSYSYFIEPQSLDINHFQIILSQNKKKIVIAHITDLHSDKIEILEKKVIDEIHKTKPDLIVITGDLATPNGKDQGYLTLLKQFSAPLGTFFVMGNWEYWAPIKDLDQILDRAKIINLTNKIHKIDDDLLLLGFDDAPTGTPDLKILEKISSQTKVISLFHSPSFIESISKNIDLALAGHSHGGQIRFPFFEAAWYPDGTGPYNAGWYIKDRAKMYVSRGLGTSLLPLRFNCKPELAFITVLY